MKKIFLIFGIFVSFIFTTLTVQANSNMLHNITLEKNNTGYNIILNTDKVTKVSKKIKSANELIIDINGITSADTVNAIYKGKTNIESLIVENNEFNKLRIYISAQNIKDSSIMIQPENGASTIVGESFPLEKAVWSAFVLLMLAGIIHTAKKVTEEDSKILIKKDIKDREIELYKKYRKDLEQSISINSKRDYKMKTMLKKIDRKIDERLSSTLR